MNNINIKIERNQKPTSPLGKGGKTRWNLPLGELDPPKRDESGDWVYDKLRISMTYNEAEKNMFAVRSHVWRWRKKNDEKAKFSVNHGETSDILIWRTE
tara:strand:- start:1485 stop:1781 length:297 start_codon:yes stop_codon:yes gene_type:complete